MSAAAASPFKGYRFPPEIISHAVWLYHRFSLSHREVEELLAERGIQVSYEAIRLWCRKFGPLLASELRRSRPRHGDKWFLDEVALTINKRRYWLWRAVDQNGTVLDILVQGRRDQHAAERFLRRVLDGEDGIRPRVIVTDKLASYVPAINRGRVSEPLLPWTSSWNQSLSAHPARGTPGLRPETASGRRGSGVAERTVEIAQHWLADGSRGPMLALDDRGVGSAGQVTESQLLAPGANDANAEPAEHARLLLEFFSS